MKISHGLMEGQVLQRNKAGRAEAKIEGSCRASGNVELRFLKNDKVVKGFNWHITGEAKGGKFFSSLKGLRTGGPYNIEFRIREKRKTLDTLTVQDVFVGDVWILAGQSNMQGVGNLDQTLSPNPKLRAFFMRDEWGIAKERLHYLEEAVDPIHNGYGDGPGRPTKKALEKMKGKVKGVGPGMGFGLDMIRRTKVPQGMIACAHGGTSMAQWSPSLLEKKGGSLYGAMMRRFSKLGQPVAGVLWYQGESDANTQDKKVYTEMMKTLVDSCRRDMNLPRLPWMVVQLGCHACAEDPASWNSIQEQQRQLPNLIPHLDVVPTIDLELDDGIHIGGKAQAFLGKRLARAADRLVHGNPKAKPGIRLKSTRLVPTPNINDGAACTSLELTFTNVAGKLVCDGKPSGFSLLNEKKQDSYDIYKTTISGKKVLLHTNLNRFGLSDKTLAYGLGRFPHCNITDTEGMSLPVIHNLPFTPKMAPICKNWQTALMGNTKSFSQLSYSKAVASKGWKKAPPRDGFGVLPKPGSSKKLGFYAMRTSISAKEAKAAKLVFGSNMPFRVWLNGKSILEDSQAKPPLNPCQYSADLKLNQGKNELLVALHVNAPGPFKGIVARVGASDESFDPSIRV